MGDEDIREEMRSTHCLFIPWANIASTQATEQREGE